MSSEREGRPGGQMTSSVPDTSPIRPGRRTQEPQWGTRARRVLWSGTNRTVIVVYIVAALFVVCTRFVNASAGSGNYVKTVVELATYTAVVGFGQGIVVMTGGFDLSIPNAMTFGAVLLTELSNGSDSRAAYIIPLVLVVGIAIGMVNGLITVLFQFSPIVVTLAMNTILGGVILVYTNGEPLGVAPAIVRSAAVGSYFNGSLPEIIVVLIGFVIIGTLLLNRTTYGRRVYAVGEDSRVASLSGISWWRVTVSAYAFSGLSAVIGGMLLAGFSGQSSIGMGTPYLLLSLAAVMVGGVAVTGGKGLYIGIVGGAIILEAISTMLAGTTLPYSVEDIIYAVAILGAVTAARLATRAS